MNKNVPGNSFSSGNLLIYPFLFAAFYRFKFMEELPMFLRQLGFRQAVYKRISYLDPRWIQKDTKQPLRSVH